MEARVENGNLILTIALTPPRLSSSGKTQVVASTGGFARTTAVDPITKQPISINLTACVPNNA